MVRACRLLVDRPFGPEGMEHKGEGDVVGNVFQRPVRGFSLGDDVADVAAPGDVAGVESGVLPRLPRDQHLVAAFDATLVPCSRESAQASWPMATTRAMGSMPSGIGAAIEEGRGRAVVADVGVGAIGPEAIR